ncbi:MAG: C40 family peptidase [Fibromonadaceae bacterium]|jgi:cell wall-associated NlpC family hydrolase|nr:C40 family peptidase [Fibromonadaceae bacterium]
MVKNYALFLSCALLFSCAITPKHENRAYYFQGKNEWGNMSSGFRYPIELEERIKEYLGVPYLWGGNDKNGIDCSAFVKQVYEIYGVNLPRTSILQSRFDGMDIPRHALLPGDLVFFGGNDTDSAVDSVTHVGIYMGKNKFANSTSSQGVKYSDLNEPFFFSKYLFARRLKL